MMPFRCLLLSLLLALAGSAQADQWALLVGVDQYEDVNHISPLSTADADARALAKVLAEVRRVPKEHIEVLTSSGPRKPTRANIIEALSRLASNLKPGDTAFVFFSGHGVQLTGRPHLLPYDFRGRDAFAGAETALSTETITGLLQKASSATIVLGWDMCRNDPFGKSKGVGAGRNRMAPPAKKAWRTVPDPSAPLRVVELFACSPGQFSYEWRDQRRGYFSYFLEQGLRGAAADAKGQITAQGLADFVTGKVRTAVRRDENGEQVPYPLFIGPGTPSIVLARAGKLPPQPPVQTPRPPAPETPKLPKPGDWLPGNALWEVRFGKWEERAGAYTLESKRTEHSWKSDAMARAEYLDTEVRPKPKNKLFIIPWELKNISKRPQPFWWFHDTALPTRILTDQETSESPYYPAGLYDINKDTDLPRSADIPPGGTLKFNLVFSLPENEKPEKLVFMLYGQGSSTPITIDLKR